MEIRMKMWDKENPSYLIEVKKGEKMQTKHMVNSTKQDIK